MSDQEFRWVEMKCECGWDVDEYGVFWADLKQRIDQHMSECTGAS